MAEPTTRTRVRRHPERGTYDRDMVRSVLDEGLVCHLAFVVDGTPFVMPTMYARSGEVVYVHGSPASRMLRAASGPACHLPLVVRPLPPIPDQRLAGTGRPPAYASGYTRPGWPG